MATHFPLRALVACLALGAARAIYEDQVGQLDWRRDHVGVPTSAVYASKVSRCTVSPNAFSALVAHRSHSNPPWLLTPTMAAGHAHVFENKQLSASTWGQTRE